MTPYLKAVKDIIECIGDFHSQTLDSPLQIILAGDAAMHIHTGRDPLDDVEMIYSHALYVPPDLGASYLSYDNEPAYVYFDSGFNTAHLLLSPGYECRALAFEMMEHRIIDVSVLSPMDLAVTKIGRFNFRDRIDLKRLIEDRLVTGAEELEQLTIAAIKHIFGHEAKLKANLDEVLCWMASHD